MKCLKTDLIDPDPVYHVIATIYFKYIVPFNN